MLVMDKKEKKSKTLIQFEEQTLLFVTVESILIKQDAIPSTRMVRHCQFAILIRNTHFNIEVIL